VFPLRTHRAGRACHLPRPRPHPCLLRRRRQQQPLRLHLRDHGARRMGHMSEAHISMQILSHLPGVASISQPSECRAANDAMAAAVRAHPTRFRGFAALPMAFPEAAAAELERTVQELGFVGAMVDNSLADMTHYHEERFWCVWAAAERLDVPVYIHPSPPSDKVVAERFTGNWSGVLTKGLATGMWGWHEEVGLHVVQLYAAGVFQKFPKLKIIIGHMGEMLPMMIARLDSVKFLPASGLPKFSEVWNRNIWVTSSGIFDVPTLEMLLKVTRMDHVMFAVDYPFNLNSEAVPFLEELAQLKVLTKEQFDMFAFGNAKKLLKITDV
ncbi:putative metal-dependent hydrolase, partial [Mycena galopus ATCC 62051]